MKRRSFLLTTSSTAAIAASWPALVSEAFAQDRPPPDAELAGLSEAYRTAQRAGHPLLVLVIPEDNGARWDRGSALGAFLNHGSDEAMIAIGSCELTCATMAVLRRLVPQAPAGEPLMVLVDPSRVPATARAIEASWPPEPPYGDDWEEQARREDARVDQQIAAIQGAVLAALSPRTGTLDAAAREAARTRATDTYRAHRIRGSYWATAGGCGVHVEEVPEQSPGFACGMGRVPDRAQRFLYFFAP